MTPSPSRTLLTALEDLARVQRETGVMLARELDCPRAGLTVVRLLSRLGPLPVGDLAERLRIDISVASRQVSGLVDAGLAQRAAPDGPGEDRRVRTVALTPRGALLAERSRMHLEARAGEAFAGWTPDELAAATDQIQKITAAVQQLHGAHPVTTNPSRKQSIPA